MFVRGYDKDDVFRHPKVVHFVEWLGGVILILVRLFVKGDLDLLSACDPGTVTSHGETAVKATYMQRADRRTEHSKRHNTVVLDNMTTRQRQTLQL
jgi:hypothetical protein